MRVERSGRKWGLHTSDQSDLKGQSTVVYWAPSVGGELSAVAYPFFTGKPSETLGITYAESFPEYFTRYFMHLLCTSGHKVPGNKANAPQSD